MVIEKQPTEVVCSEVGLCKDSTSVAVKRAPVGSIDNIGNDVECAICEVCEGAER